jgi:cobalt-zinc-cadmium efflux system outer membrane protein
MKFAHHRRVRAALCVLWFPLACFAQAPLQGKAFTSVDLPEFLALVEQHNPELAASRQQRLLAEAESQIASAYPNPELEIGGGPWRSRSGGASGTATEFQVTQPIELPSVRAARIGAADAGIESAGAQAQAARLSIGYQARQAFFELQRRLQDERLARENAELLGQIRDRVLKRVEVGEAARFELVRAESEVLVAQNALAASGLRAEEARASLRRLSGSALPALFGVRGAAPELPSLPPLPSLQAEVLAAHPALRALAAERERARRRLEQERALRAPQPALRFGEARDPEMRAASVGLTLSIPLWNRREGQIAQASASIELLSAQAEQQRAILMRELDSAYARLSIAQRQISTFEAGLLRSAEAALQVAESAYRFGERSFLDVLDAQRTLRSVRGDHNQARYERVAAWLDIERLRARDPFQPEAR